VTALGPVGMLHQVLEATDRKSQNNELVKEGGESVVTQEGIEGVDSGDVDCSDT